MPDYRYVSSRKIVDLPSTTLFKRSLKNHEDDINDATGCPVTRRKRRTDHFPIRFLPPAITFPLFSFRFNYSSRHEFRGQEKYCLAGFVPAAGLSRQHPGPDFRGAPSPCAIDPFSLQVSWEGPWTGRYT